jgi:ComF family protein
LQSIIFSKILNDITNVLLPRSCFGCNTHLNRGEQYLCTVCRNHLPLTDYTFNEENPIDRIFYGRIRIKKASSFLFFTENSIVQRLIHHLKYKDQEQIGDFLGDWYGQILKENQFLDKIDIVIPVPLHKRKLAKRGYNQVDAFAKRLAYYLDAEYANGILIKTANTKTQTTKGRMGRWQEDKDLYMLSDDTYLKNKNVLLVDDVITSGATMETCSKAIQKAQGVNIYLASMATVLQFQ